MIVDFFFLLFFFIGLEFTPFQGSPWLSFSLTTLLASLFTLYAILFFLGMTTLFRKPKYVRFMQMLLLSGFLFLFYGTHLPHYFASFTPFSKTAFTTFALFLYLSSLFLVCLDLCRVRLLSPFILVYFFYPLLQETLFSIFHRELTWVILVVGFPLLFFFLPPLLVRMWGCQPLQSSPLKEQLEQFCLRHRFRYRELQVFTTMRNAITAAILGIFPRFRYLLFTPLLMEFFPPEEMESVIAHEIGHSRHKHLFLYPFLLMGAFPLIILSSTLLFSFGQWISILGIFCICFLYLWAVIAPFSRIMEKQADLYALHLGLQPVHVIGALKRLSALAKVNEEKSFLFHGSIKERILIIDHFAKYPASLPNWNRKVRNLWLVYFFLLGLSSIFLYVSMN